MHQHVGTTLKTRPWCHLGLKSDSCDVILYPLAIASHVSLRNADAICFKILYSLCKASNVIGKIKKIILRHMFKIKYICVNIHTHWYWSMHLQKEKKRTENAWSI